MPTFRVLLAILLFSTACAHGPTRSRPLGATPLYPEDWYEVAYEDVKECLAKYNLGRESSNFDEIRWFSMPHGALENVAGLWSSPYNIYLDEKYVFNYKIIRHELAHFVLGANLGDHHELVEFRICVEAPTQNDIRIIIPHMEID